MMQYYSHLKRPLAYLYGYRKFLYNTTLLISNDILGMLKSFKENHKSLT